MKCYPPNITQQWKQRAILPDACTCPVRQGEASDSFPPECLMVLVNQAVEVQTRSAAPLSRTQSSSLSRIPEPPPSVLEAHAVLRTEPHICGMAEAIKSADNFQQICICCYCCCLCKCLLANHKYKSDAQNRFRTKLLVTVTERHTSPPAENHSAKESRRNSQCFPRGSQAKHLLQNVPGVRSTYLEYVLQRPDITSPSAPIKVVTNLRLVPGCLSSGAVPIV